MNQTPFPDIFHPTDFSEASDRALAHALRIAAASGSGLTLLHADALAQTMLSEWDDFPRVRAIRERWREAGNPLAAHDGFSVLKAKAAHVTELKAIERYLDDNPQDLIVLATSGKGGLPRFLHDAVAEPLARHAQTPTLFVPADAPGFVDLESGACAIRHVLIPVDQKPNAHAAVRLARQLLAALAIEAPITLFHVGKESSAPTVPLADESGIQWAFGSGDEVDAIVEAAQRRPTDLIVMATAGHDGFLDLLRGSVTERVLRRAPCAVLAVPEAKP